MPSAAEPIERSSRRPRARPKFGWVLYERLHSV